MTPIARVTKTRHELKSGEPLNISLLFDLHVDSSLCDYDGLQKMLAERNRLPNHLVTGCGDLFDLVMPTDLKRFRPSVQHASIATRDDWFNAALDHAGEKIENLRCKWVFVGKGNHEDEALKRHGWDATSVLAARLGCPPAGYMGVHDFEIATKGSNCVSTFRLAWHHGSWGGNYAKGYNSALTYFGSVDSWDVAAWGHNHSSRVDPEVRYRPDPIRGELVERRVYLVACGSWVYSQSSDARITHYTERHGYRPQPRQSPLVTVVQKRTNNEREGRRLYNEVSITV